ncbi:MAG: arsenic resistance protein [Pseudomonadota bacterium]
MLSKPLERAAAFMGGRGTAIILLAAILIGSASGIVLPSLQSTSSSYIDFTILLLVFLLLFEVRIQSILSSANRINFIIAALVVNFLIIPALGFAIASVLLSAHPLFFIGLAIYFMAPCTDWFLAFTRLAGGNTALGAALLPINMIVQLLLYPVYLHIFGVDSVGAAGTSIFQVLWQWFLVPLLMAVALRFLAERILRKEQLESVQAVASIMTPILLAVLVGQISAANIGVLLSNASVFPLILLGVLLFFIATYFLGETVSKIMKLDYPDRVLMTMTTAARNAPLMLALTMAVMPDQPLIYSAIIIGMLIELPHLVGLKVILKRQHAKAEQRLRAFS